MIVADAVFFTYRDALRRGGPEYLAFERAVTVYRERFHEASQAEANFAVSKILAEAATGGSRAFWIAEGEAPAA
ncbi:hypothetical protein [Rhodospirillaceae bacterium SYSU D60014]|jgi:hypothetical protein|uniref:hypothetical protein n=1 Tax=Virgifigura deserti TaxID=2268457 RepID=UPI0013C4BFA0